MIVRSVLWALLVAVVPDAARGVSDVCDFEKPCPWDVKDGGFKIVTGQEVNNSLVPSDGRLGGPFTDADNNTNGAPGVLRESDWLIKSLPHGGAVGACGRYVPVTVWIALAAKLEIYDIYLVNIKEDLIEKVWQDRPSFRLSHIFPYPRGHTGKSAQNKINNVRSKMANRSIDLLIVTELDEIAWILNLRGRDLEYSPVFFAFLIIERLHLHIFVDELNEEVTRHLFSEGIRLCVYDYHLFYDCLYELASCSGHRRIWISDRANYQVYSSIPKRKVLIQTSPIAIEKCIKNDVEAQGMIEAHVYDGYAMCKFFCWLSKSVKKRATAPTEMSAAEMLEQMKRMNSDYLGPSCHTISAAGKNSAVVRYRAQSSTDKVISPNDIYLCEAGSHYLSGTTNVTRTYCFGKATDFQKECYTRVVKGLINLGHFLYLLVKNKELETNREYHIRSPRFLKSVRECRMLFWSHMYMEQPDNAAAHTLFLQSGDKKALLERKLQEGNIKVVIETGTAKNKTQWVIKEWPGNDHNRWENQTVTIGSQEGEFMILLVVTPSRKQPHHVAIDNITLVNCFQDDQHECLASQFQCSNDSACIDFTSVCDIQKDCPDGEDEEQGCDEVPPFAHCNFEDGMCGWKNKDGRDLNWKFKNGSLTATGLTGPNFDHTHKNSSGTYIYVDMSGTYKMGTSSELESPFLNPPPKYHSNTSSPYYNSCYISFFYHKFGPHSGSLGLFIVELERGTNHNRTHKLWWGYGTRTDKWLKKVVILPHNITGRYYMLFEARKSYASRGDPAIDDIAMSPKCFGKGVPAAHLDGYDYDKFDHGGSDESPLPPVTHKDFVNATVYAFTTCNNTGREGPGADQCEAAYNNTEVAVTVIEQKPMKGFQKWTVPEGGFYTIIAKGASGGKGSDELGSSRGALVRTVVELTKGQNIYILVGQEGNQACPKNFLSSQKGACNTNADKKSFHEKMHKISRLNFLSEGGGGGGATYVFTIPKNSKEKKPLVVAAGGGGLGHGSKVSDSIHHGHGINRTLQPLPGEVQTSPIAELPDGHDLLKNRQTQQNKPAGTGGGWKGGNHSSEDTMGLSLLQGGTGGKACYESLEGNMGAGGFGGGGGGCTSGGGGGGYTGGRAWNQKAALGEGGYSWIEIGILHRVSVATTDGAGAVYVIPAIQGCDCDYLCVALDPHRATTQCLCPDNWHLSNDSIHCIMNPSASPLSLPTALMGAVSLVVIIIVTVFMIYLYSRYLKKKNALIRRKMLSGPDLQLNRLRVASDSMMTEYNPNYEFGGAVYSLKDLKEIPREHLRLVKALGQGAFGEVYQGLYRARAGDAVEMPVAVKTLPHLSTSQAETDFLMEALIMSKFNHPNIVHFIGVCFDQHPRFIVIELLAGGDLKTFLRESRPKPDRAAQLTMKDLLSCIMDVAKGCKYMEDHRFIHRDIAARNCLLTSKGPGRVVKIADFGMARDIYRADYYRKGGKAMLPIKWMPPEAFLDGIFTTKTDVWSFGVLTWEVLSMGYMPYTGCANREVMQLVTNGGRLAPPSNCPSQIYAIMTQCWQPNPEERPGFGLILERLGYCMQDPDVKRAPLPVYSKPPSSERDKNALRPSAVEDCIQPDYLIPLSGPQEWDFPDPHMASRSTQMLVETGVDAVTTPPVVNHVVHVNTNNNNNPTVPPISKPHLNNLNSRTDPSVYTVSSTLKQDTEISC